MPLCGVETTPGVGVICRGMTGGDNGTTGGGGRWAGAVATDASICSGGAVDGFGDLAGVADIAIPCPCLPNGPITSAGTSTVFWVGLRIKRLGLNRARTLLNGSTTGSESYSSWTLNKVGAARRSSPKVILTMPSDSCGWIFFKAMEMLARLKSTFFALILERNSGGSVSKTA